MTVAVQEADPGSTLALYRAALARRRREPGLLSSDFTWADSTWADGAGDPRSPVLAFLRGDVLCLANTGAVPVAVPAAGAILLASGPLPGQGPGLVLPPDTTVWCRAGEMEE